jgi:transposase-like protein
MSKAERGTTDPTQAQISEAATKAFGKKFCFSCQTYKPLSEGSNEVHRRNRWRCFLCQKKQRPLSGLGY